LESTFSDSEFSDCSIASTDAFLRTPGYRYGNAEARKEKLEKGNRRHQHYQVDAKIRQTP
jgi:hypothetical protein